MNVRRQSPHVSPDSMRQKLHMDERFFDSHTKKSVGYEHQNGTQYSGNIQNWGSELLLETRKMRLNRPPLGDIILNHAFREYFTLQYDDNLNTYEQENAIMGLLKKNVLSDDRAYLKFENVTKMLLPRAQASSESYVYPHLVWKTSTPPILHIHDVDYPLIATDPEGGETTYWFQNTSTNDTGSMSQFYLDNDDEQPVARILLDEDHTTETTLNTRELQYWMEELPLVWLTFSTRRTLPEFKMINNVDMHGHPILTAGSDGHGKHWLYPFVYGNENIPGEITPTGNNPTEWQIRIYTKGLFLTGDTDTAKENNRNQYISQIQFVKYRNGDATSEQNHMDVVNIPFTSDDVKLKLTDDDRWGDTAWKFRAPEEGDWDYDGTRYQNPVYGYINGYLTRETYVSTPAKYRYLHPIFQIILDQDTLNRYDWIRNNVALGIHIDDAPQGSTNGVMEKNGTIFHLGDFDGLPPYYDNRLPKTTHRPHVELYAVKDVVHDNIQNAMDKRVAALLVDGAIPQTEIQSISDEIESCISFTYEDIRTYDTIESKVLSIMNAKSDIGYASRSEFGDVNLTKYKDKPIFIYHGKRTFSLGAVGFDSELETARVYYLSNDSIAYDNNASSLVKKPDLTLARICDIPTQINQLISIRDKAPALLLDDNYVRTDTCYDVDAQNLILQLTNYGVFVHDENIINHWMTDLDVVFDYDYLCEHYGKVVQPNTSIQVKHGIHTTSEDDVVYEWNIVSSNTGYRVGDLLQVYLAGQIFKGVVSEIDTSGAITRIDMGDPNRTMLQIPLTNFDSQVTTLTSSIISRNSTYSHGDGCRLTFTIPDDIWKQRERTTDGVLDGLFTLKYDIFGNIWIWTFVETWRDIEDENGEITKTHMTYWEPACQLTGEPDVGNLYDTPTTRDSRSFVSVFLQSLTRGSVVQVGDSSDFATSDGIGYQKNIEPFKHNDTSDISFAEALTSILDEEQWVKEDCYYAVYPDMTDEDWWCIDECTMGSILPTSDPVQYPAYHKAVIHPSYHKPTNLIFGGMYDGYSTHHGTVITQPNVFMYDPFATRRDLYQQCSDDIVQLVGSHLFTFMDFPSSIWTQTQTKILLNCDIWRYHGYDIERTDDDRCMYHPNVLDDKTAISLYRKKDEVIANYNQDTGEVTPVGDQPTGLKKAISTRYYPSKYYLTNDNRTITSHLVYFFQIPDGVLITSFDGFHMKDQYSHMDVSKYTILLYRNTLYMFDEENDTWIKVRR